MSDQQETKDCPFCAEKINAKAIKCKHCESMLNDDGQQMKDCPFCFEQINAKDVKCSHCQSNLISSTLAPQAMPASHEKGQLLESLISEYHKVHRISHPLPQIEQTQKSGLMGFINKKISDIKGVSEVAFLDEITPQVLTKHHEYTVGLKPHVEKPLFVVNTTCGMTKTGLMLTTQNLYYSIKPGKTFSLGLAKNIHGHIAIRDIHGISVGDSDTGFGTAYNGHDFFLNGEKVGWLRMGTGIMWDDEVLECTKSLFSHLSSEVFSR